MQKSLRQQTPAPRVAFVHTAARLHYALAVAVPRAGMLDRMYTEWFSTPGSVQEKVAKLVRLANRDLGQRMLERHSPHVDPSRVALRSTLPLLMAQRIARQSLQDRFEKLDRVMVKAAWIALRKGFGDANVLMSFVRDTHPSLFAGAQALGLKTVADQIIAPAAIEHEELTEQFRRWPQWQRAESFDHLPKVARNERATWAAADHITCASDYVKQGLIREGVEPQRVSVLPYPLEAENYPVLDRRPGAAGGRSASDPFTVGFVGHVNLRKGAPYFVEVAKRLRGRGIRFVMVGTVCLEPSVVEPHRDAVEFIGPVPRSQVREWLRRFDVFLFPSTCEGSAGSVMEAMSTGLPVVASPNSGTVARHGTEGFIAAYDQIDAMAEAVDRLASNPELRHEMGRAASRRVGGFTIDWYSREIAPLLRQLVVGPAEPSRVSEESVVTTA